MSSISDVWDQIVTTLDTTYPSGTYFKLFNPYQVEGNDDFLLNKGYGIKIGPSEGDIDELNHFLVISRELVLQNTVVTRGTDRDITIRENSEKELLEDQLLGIAALMRLNPPAEFKPIRFNGDGGADFVFDDKNNFLLIESSFTLSYRVDIDYCKSY